MGLGGSLPYPYIQNDSSPNLFHDARNLTLERMLDGLIHPPVLQLNGKYLNPNWLLSSCLCRQLADFILGGK